MTLVQDKVRYVALAMAAGGYVPADASATWSRRFGDCKGKTALLLGLLHSMSIEAVPVLVSSSGGDGLDQRLPLVGVLDHVIVRAIIGGRVYWLDGTRKDDVNLDRLTVPYFGWGLPVVPTRAALLRMQPQPLDKPAQDVAIDIDARQGLTIPAPFKVRSVFRGDNAVGMKTSLDTVVGEARTRALRDYWKGECDFVEMKTATADFDPATGEERLTMDGIATMDWHTGWYETDGTGVGYKADFSRESGSDKDAPFVVPYPIFNRTTETIQLPPGFTKAKAGDSGNIDLTVAGIKYKRHASMTGTVFTIERSERSVMSEFPASEATAAQKTLCELADQTVYLRRPDSYSPTEQELAVLMATPPTTVQAALARGNLLLDRNRFDEAIADFDRAIALDPKSVWAIADRGIAKVHKQDFASADKDIAAAAALDPKNIVVLRARGLAAELKDNPKEAVAAYDRALTIVPNDPFSLSHRAQAHHSAGSDDAALADSAALLVDAPQSSNLRLMRANIYRQRGQRDNVLAELTAMTDAAPDQSYAFVAAANMYHALGEEALATQSYDRAFAIEPEAYIYLNRAENRDVSDLIGCGTDIDAALKLEPGMTEALAMKARLAVESHDYQTALVTYATALKAKPKDVNLLAQRGVAYLKSGDATAAERDFAAARANALTPGALNSLCWFKATENVALDSALADCEAALATMPDNTSFLDSRALLKLRMNRLDGAIADYGRALATTYPSAGSYYGRAIAWARKGEAKKSEADRLAAVKRDSRIAEQFERYGLEL